MIPLRALLVLSVAVPACDDGGDASSDAARVADATVADAAPGDAEVDRGAERGYAPCPYESRVGAFKVALEAGFTSVQGQVADGVVPLRVPDVTASDGPCRLLQPPVFSCEPACEVGSTCGADGCVPNPGNVSVGVVTVSGLTAAVEMEARAPVFFYTHRGELPHPAFSEGDLIELRAAGDAVEAFALGGSGVALLEVAGDAVALRRGEPTRLTWSAGENPEAALHIELNIANHGGTPAWIECDVPDSGLFAIPASLGDQLLDLGFSGFPSIALTRRTADSTTTGLGCVELTVESAVVLDVAIDGLVSCSGDEDCPRGQTCQADLTCE